MAGLKRSIRKDIALRQGVNRSDLLPMQASGSCIGAITVVDRALPWLYHPFIPSLYLVLLTHF